MAKKMERPTTAGGRTLNPRRLSRPQGSGAKGRGAKHKGREIDGYAGPKNTWFGGNGGKEGGKRYQEPKKTKPTQETSNGS